MKIALHCLMLLFCTVFPQAGLLRQSESDTAITFTASPTTVKPGETVTLTWKIPAAFDDLDHVTIEMSHPILAAPVVFEVADREGTLSVAVPLDYYDAATFWLSPRMAGDRRYTGADGSTVYARTDVTVDDGVAVTKFRADPNPADRGAGVLISWEVSGLDPDTTPVILGYYGNDGIWVQTSHLPPVGTTVLEPPAIYTETFTVILLADKVMSGNRLEVGIRCPFAEFLGPHCPFTHEPVTLRYQPFEHGWLIARGDNILIVHADGYFYEWSKQVDAAAGTLTPPEGLQAPAPEFAAFWSDHSLADTLGWAVAGESAYTTLFDTVLDTAGRHPVTGYYFYLPSGDLIHANPITMLWNSAN